MSRSDIAGRPVHLVVTCANRKTRIVPDHLRLGSLHDQLPGKRFAAWAHRLSTCNTERVAAIDLYAGEHWQIARRLPASLQRAAKLWVCSAGYGLITADAPIAPYAATFTAGEADAAGSSSSAMRDWWSRLNRWNGPDIHAPRSFTTLARQNPHAAVIAVLSEAYLRACADDLRQAARCLASREQLAIIGPPGRCSGIDDLIVPVTATLRPVVGGSMQALNVRAAAHLLTAAADDLSHTNLRKLAEQATATAPPDPSRRPNGQKLSDKALRDFIRGQLTNGPVTATSLLRQLRQSGQSCEQSRFHALFADVAAKVTR
ncbi:hypothetical protein ACIBJE_19990 [Micromonospora sp. NPDC050187]|uniref:hypothetical protein n=1 Tax=Micromonospora sp. NPDC050187 TaxID=3364277 RepID=UPI0037B95586